MAAAVLTLQAFPLVARDACRIQDGAKERSSDVRTMSIGSDDTKISAHHKLVPPAGERALESSVPEGTYEVAA